MTIRPYGLACYQGIPATVLAVLILGAELFAASRSGVVIATGIASMLVAAISWVPVLKVDDREVHVRNFLRGRRFPHHEVRSFGLRSTPLLFSRGINYSRLVVDDGTRQLVVSATTGMSRSRMQKLLKVLESAGFVIAPEVQLDEFPVHDGWAGMQRASAQAATEWEEQQETYRRLELARHRHEQNER